MSANGSRDTANRYFIDGVEAMDHDTETYSFLWNWWYSFFVNDDWKIRPNLTINLGMRSDYFQRPVQSEVESECSEETARQHCV
jgi:hypothetical protein